VVLTLGVAKIVFHRGESQEKEEGEETMSTVYHHLKIGCGNLIIPWD